MDRERERSDVDADVDVDVVADTADQSHALIDTPTSANIASNTSLRASRAHHGYEHVTILYALSSHVVAHMPSVTSSCAGTPHHLRGMLRNTSVSDMHLSRDGVDVVRHVMSIGVLARLVRVLWMCGVMRVAMSCVPTSISTCAYQPAWEDGAGHVDVAVVAVAVRVAVRALDVRALRRYGLLSPSVMTCMGRDVMYVDVSGGQQWVVRSVRS